MTHVSSLYLHVPFCKHLCNYCDFYKKLYEPGSNQIEDFHRSLENSWLRHEELMKTYSYEWQELATLYLGGGTPSLWGIAGAEFLGRWFKDRLNIKKDAEFTMEVDPGTWTSEMIESWKAIGLNRISIGTQTLDPNFIKIMDRSHSLDETHQLLDYCQKNDWNFSLDFLLGLPFSREKKRDIESELNQLLKYNPKHISLYILNARSKYPHIQSMPDDEFIREEYLFVSEYLQKLGFVHYEVSNFALPGFEAKHNVKYWKGEAVAALGPTGTGYFPQNKTQAFRYKWKVSKAEVEVEELGNSELNLEHIYLSLRTNLGWKPDEMKPALDQLFSTWETMKYGQFSQGRMQLNSLGFLMLDSLMDDLFRIGI
jgi:oxygen-independent coproporphyrinogen III oxidase